MANFEIHEEQAALVRELRKLETSDPVHADVYNALFEKLINNDAFLERLANKMIEKSMLCHVLDSVNTQQVLAADVGPKITKITDGLQKSISGLNTDKYDKDNLIHGNTDSFSIPANSEYRIILDLSQYNVGTDYRLHATIRGSTWVNLGAIYCNNNQTIIDTRNLNNTGVNISLWYTIIRK